MNYWDLHWALLETLASYLPVHAWKEVAWGCQKNTELVGKPCGSQRARNSFSSLQGRRGWKMQRAPCRILRKVLYVKAQQKIKLLKTNDKKKIWKSPRKIRCIVTHRQSNKEEGGSKLFIRNYAHQIHWHTNENCLKLFTRGECFQKW